MDNISQKVGYDILEIMEPDDIMDTSEYPMGNRKVVIFDDLVNAPAKIQSKIVNHFTDGRNHQISPIYLTQSYYDTPQKISDINPRKCKNKADRKMVKALDAVPYDERQWGHWLARNVINTKQKLGLGVKQHTTAWSEQLVDELHKPIKRKFPKRRVIVNHIDDIWCSDLVEMQKFSKWIEGFRFLLMVLDVFSKYGWTVPLKNKKGESVAQEFKKIFFERRKPKLLSVDKGSEYYNKDVKDLMKSKGVEMYSTENEEKSSVCERWNRTIKTKMWKQFSIQNNTKYLDILPKIVEKYNNTKHRSIGMTPVEASKKKNESDVYLKLYCENVPHMATPKFEIGDQVRISKYKRKVFDKGYTPNWTEEILSLIRSNTQSRSPIS
ncbi:putative uncharacterized transposon-derived protein F54H12.3 [Stylophora pistillata]|uniref:Uncharacterized transposon-derived protein F54H12.3 n=1 Tax=Stylophora pistillata TaxID=50429 RepID=A0A2B4RMG7_STYPI|nr:putative uncharacterized transposon-derived protein F54H12.3 [Stylophora pistillata]